MFTGIIQDIGTVTAIDKTNGDWTLSIATKLPLAASALGASIACSGVCLTMVEKTDDLFKVQVSPETLSKTSIIHWQNGTRINLEPALRMGDELGGHLLSGHVDGLLRVVAKENSGDSVEYIFQVPSDYLKYIAAKGSVAINGVSLTVNDVKEARFGVNIIPFTQQMTTLSDLTVGDEANFEIDMIARYTERMLQGRIKL